MRTYFYSYCINKLHYFSIVVLTSFLFFAGYAVNAQTIKTVGATGDYTTLKAAFDAINAGSITGAIELQIISNTTETATAVLNASGSGSSSYTDVKVYPTSSGLKITINSASATLISLNGADNVTFDGRVNQLGSQVDLEIINISSSANATVFEFINGATQNIIQYCLVRGRGFGSKTMFFFGTSTNGIGNSNNVIQHNKLTNSGTDYRYDFVVYSSGTSGAVNSNNVIKGNAFYDLIQRSVSSMALINITANSSGWEIDGNSFYETAPITWGINTSILNFIRIDNTSGGGFVVKNNYIGGQDLLCSGGKMTLSQASVLSAFEAISISVGASNPSVVENNTIQNIQWRTDNIVPSQTGSFVGILVKNGSVTIGSENNKNTIGSTTIAQSIILENNTNITLNAYGIYVSSPNAVTISYNSIGGIYTDDGASSSYEAGYSIYGIYKSNTAGLITIHHNSIGSKTVTNSIEAGNNGNLYITSQYVVGIESLASGTCTIYNNTIQNLTNQSAVTSINTTNYGITQGIRVRYGTFQIYNNEISQFKSTNNITQSSAAAELQPLCGITVINVCASVEIYNNQIFDLTHTTTNFNGNISGVYLIGYSTGNFICRGNFIHSIISNSPDANVFGIVHAAHNFKIFNNVISIGNNLNCSVYGFANNLTSSTSSEFYFNTIYLSGNPTNGAKNSFCYYGLSSSSIAKIQNNILVNARSNNGATGIHYATYFNYTTSTNLTLDNNLYYTSGLGGILSYFNNINVNSLPLVSGKDVNSFNQNPLFTNPGSTLVTDYMISNTNLFGTSISVVTSDYLGLTRVNNTVGAFEFVNINGGACNFYIGPTNGLWSLASNWSLNHIPISNEHVFVSKNIVLLDVDYVLDSTNSLIVSQTGAITVKPTKVLTINGSADFGNRPIVFMSDATGYGQLGKVSGTITGATNVQSENYVAARRAYRLLTSPVTTTTSIRANWQENSNNTSLDYANNQNPNPGFGTHITGSATGLNGFDATATGNSSLYTFTNATQAWSAIANTNNTALTVGQPYRLMVRGDRSIDLSTNTPDPTPTVLRATGTLQIGNFSTTLSTTANHYNLVANPYQSPIYANTMFGSPSNYTNVNNQFFYVWDPQLGLRGAYTTITIASGAATGGSTHTNKINPWEAFFVKTGVDGASSIVFKEDYKNPPVIVMGRSSDTPDTNSSLTLNLKGLQVNGDYQYVDGIRMDFGVDYALEIDSFDAEKFINLDEDVAIQKQNQLLTVERRAIPTVTETVPLQVTKYRSTSYIFENQAVGLDGVQAFLKDNYTNILHELEGTPYAFTVNTAIPASFENNRFELVFQNSALNTSNFEYSIGLYPNPSQGATGFYLSNMTADTKVALFTLLGQSVPVATVLNGNTLQVHPKSSLCQGVYLVQVTSPEGLTKQVKWIVE